MKTVGLALGKFAPLHKGHELVLDTATRQTDEQIFVIYDSPSATDIPLRIRANWIRKLYPNAQVIEAWGGPEQVGLDPETMLKQEEFLVKLLGELKVTHFFSSEEYGEHVAARLGAINFSVDIPRSSFPISGTEIRRDLFANKSFVSPIVYRDLVLNVVFLGAPGSGKSTIAEECSKVFQTVFMPEYGREYWENNNVVRRLTLEQLEEIAIGHIDREEIQIQLANRYLFVDTDASTTSIFAEYYHGDSSEFLIQKSKEASSRYDLVFLCMPDFAYVETEDRSGDVARQEFHDRIVDYLKYSKRPYVELYGSVDERIQKVKDVLSKTSKFQKINDWRANA